MNGKIFSALIIVLIAIATLAFYFKDDASSGSENLRKFSSQEELVSYINEAAKSKSSYTGRGSALFADSGGALTSESAAGASNSGSSSGSGAIAGSDYSGTNLQVIGVDEPDTVKNDGKYIYTVNQNKVTIVEAYPADSMKIVSELEFDNYVNGIFVENDQLIVIESSYGYYFGGGLDVISPSTSVVSPETSVVFAESNELINDVSASNDPQYGAGSSGTYGINPGPIKSAVNIHVYDISGKLISNPNLLETFSVEGNYNAARLIDGNVYVISNKYIDYSNPVVPFFEAGGDVKSASVSQIYYPSYYESNLMFTSVMAIDVSSLKYKADVFITGYNSVIYVSKNSIYLVSPKTYDYSKVQVDDNLRIVSRFLSGEPKAEVEKILGSNDEYYVKSNKINLIVQNYFNKLSTDEKKEFEESLAKANQDYYGELSKKYEKTLIYKIEIDGLKINYKDVSEVPGYVLNQFSMDEFEGNFRIATTTGNIFGNGVSLNHLYVLNSDLEIIGQVEDIAPGERIYSARFLEDKAYMVTFRQVDPLYVIDLSNPKSPEILGFLKVTGFSNYLHPIGNNLLLGIGREATLEGRQQGLKISTFDVSDFENPKEVDSYVVEATGSYSQAEYEHKAVLFDDKRDLLVIPVSYSQQLGDKWEYWQGAYVFTVTDNDISLKGKIDHKLDSQYRDGRIGYDVFYGYSYGYISRSLFIEDFLYTISNSLIKANAISDLKEISEVKLV